MRTKSGRALLVISPASTIRPVLASDSSATRELGSSARCASRTASEIWSHILSGWPSETDSEVNRKSLSGIIRDCSLQGAFRGGPSRTGIQLMRMARETEGFNLVLFRGVSIAPAGQRKKPKNSSAPQDFQVVKV